MHVGSPTCGAEYAGYRRPMASTEPMPSVPAWERRFRAPILSFPAWAADDPERLSSARPRAARYQLHAWDRRTGVRRQVTFDPVGILDGRPTRDGTGVVWFHDDDRRRDRRLGRRPVRRGRGAGAAARRAAARAGPRGSRSAGAGPSPGSAIRRRASRSGSPTTAATCACSTSTRSPCASPAPSPRRRRRAAARCPPTRRSSSLERQRGRRRAAPVAARRSTRRPATSLGELRTRAGAGRRAAFSPVPGDAPARDHARAHRRPERPAVWDARTGEVVDLELDLVGPVEAVDWWPDGGSLLLLQLVEGRHRLHRFHLDTRPGRAARHRARLDHRGRRPPRRRASGTASTRRAPGAASSRPARRRRCSRPRARPRRLGRDFESWWFDEPRRGAGPRLPRPARGRRPAPGDPARPRRAALRWTSTAGRRTSWPTSTPASSSRWSTTAARWATGRRGATR